MAFTPLNSLNAFIAVARRLSYAAAARDLGVVLERYAPEVPGLYLYYPSRSQVSPALEAFVEVARGSKKE